MEFSYVPKNELNMHALNRVFDLTQDQLSQVVDSDEYLTVIYFYSTWSLKCKNLSPHYNKLPNKYKNAKFYQINGNINDDYIVDCNSCKKPAIHLYFKGHLLCQLLQPDINDITNKIEEMTNKYVN